MKQLTDLVGLTGRILDGSHFWKSKWLKDDFSFRWEWNAHPQYGDGFILKSLTGEDLCLSSLRIIPQKCANDLLIYLCEESSKYCFWNWSSSVCVCVYQIESPCKNKAGVWLGHGKLHFITEVWSHRIANLVLEADQNRRIHNCPRGRDACDCESDFPPITFHVCWNNPTSMICFPWRLSWSSVLWLHSVGCLLMYNSLPVPI